MSFLRALVASQSGPVPLGCVLVLTRVPVLQYDLSASTFSPDGRVFQVEYAMKAVENSRSAALTHTPSPACPPPVTVEMVTSNIAHKLLRRPTGRAERCSADAVGERWPSAAGGVCRDACGPEQRCLWSLCC